MLRSTLLILILVSLPALATTRKHLEFKSTPQGTLAMDVFFPADWKASDRRPAIVFFFGGGFRNGSTRQFFTKAQYFASRGMVAASAEYRIQSKHGTTPRESMEDCRSAIRWIRSKATELGIDPNKLAAGGGSAGATCAVMAAVKTPLDSKAENLSISSKPDVLVLFNPAMEAPLLGELSPNRHISEGIPPTVMFFGTDDPLLAPAREYTRRARESKNRVMLYLAKGQKHGFFNDRPDSDYSWHASTTYMADAFLQSSGYVSGRPTMLMPALSKAVLYQETPPQNVPSPPSPANIRIERDILFAKTPEKDLKLDLYLPSAPAPNGRPLIVWVHGGAWRAGTKNSVPLLRFLDDGYAIASVTYRLSHEAAFPAQLHDVKAAIRWLRANASKYGYDGKRIGVAGSSAGGHLVALLGTTGDVPALEGELGHPGISSAVQAVVDFYGPTKLERMSGFPSAMNHDAPDSPENQLIGAFVNLHPDLAARVNPITHVSKGDAPFLIIHGDADQLVTMEQSELLHAALKKAGVESTFRPIAGARHGGPEFSTPELTQEIKDFLAKALGK